MDNREIFEAWWASNGDDEIDTKVAAWLSWQACAEQKDKEIAELRNSISANIKQRVELTDNINKVWADTYTDAVPADTMLALKNRVKNLAEDRACWVFNARVLQNKLNAMETK